MKEINFTVDIVNDASFDDLIAEIKLETQRVFLITQEEGLENLRIKIYPPENKDLWDFRFDEFEDTMNKAKNHLCDPKKIYE